LAEDLAPVLVRVPLLPLRAGVLEAAGLRLAAALRAGDLRALPFLEAVRRPAALPRLLEREPVVRAMFRHSMRYADGSASESGPTLPALAPCASTNVELIKKIRCRFSCSVAPVSREESFAMNHLQAGGLLPRALEEGTHDR
jgi:hypothetical protein